MHVLLTNDDGFDAPGLLALFHAVRDEHRVSVVAPSSQRSSCGHATTLNEPILVRRLRHEIMGDVHTVCGTPADCVRLAVAGLIGDPIDCVISGINAGANVSIVDTCQSGTVAGVREATFCGIRGIAFSQLTRADMDVDWPRATRLVQRLLPQLIRVSHSRRAFWNVNLPCLPPGAEPDGVRVLPLSRDHVPLAYSSDDAPLETGRTYRYNGYYHGRVMSPGTDVEAVFGREISITPIGVDPADVTLMEMEFGL